LPPAAASPPAEGGRKRPLPTNASRMRSSPGGGRRPVNEISTRDLTTHLAPFAKAYKSSSIFDDKKMIYCGRF
jgi:hypothetical protein